MLIRLDPSKGATAVMSLPRDLQGRTSPATGARRSTPPTPTAAGKLADQDDRRACCGFAINHVVSVKFCGFRDAIDRLGCVYIDVDRRYYQRNLGLAASQQYAEINVKPGYQKLCGQKALDYVRFRHDGQRPHPRGAPAGIPAPEPSSRSASASSRPRPAQQLLRIFGRYTQTDISSSRRDPRGCSSSWRSPRPAQPLQQVRSRPARRRPDGHARARRRHAGAIRAAAQRLPRRPRPPEGDRGSAASTGGRAPQALARASASGPTSDGAVGLYADGEAEDRLAPGPRSSWGPSRLLPEARDGLGSYADHGAAALHDPRPSGQAATRPTGWSSRGRRRRVLRHPGHDAGCPRRSSTPRTRPRTVRRPQAAALLRRLAACASSPGGPRKAVYWVSNTLAEALTNKQMLGIARSLTRVGS